MNYKKVYCKKTVNPTSFRLFEKGKSYYYHEEDTKGQFWIIENDKYSVGYRFKSVNTLDWDFNFNEHFSVNAQKRIERKQKIEKINESR